MSRAVTLTFPRWRGRGVAKIASSGGFVVGWVQFFLEEEEKTCLRKYWWTEPMGAVAIAVAGAFFMAMPAALSSAAATEDKKIRAIAAGGGTAPTAGSPTYTSLDEPMGDNVGNRGFNARLSTAN